MKILQIMILFIALVIPSGIAFAQSDEAYNQLQKANKLASAGAITRSIPHYERAIELAPGAMPQAYFNLAEVYRARGDCKKAALPYQAYAAYVGTDEAKKEVEKALRSCKSDSWKELTVQVKPASARVKIAGMVFPPGAATVRLPSGSYEVEVEAVDHHTSKLEIALDKKTTRKVELEKMKFKGKMKVEAPKDAKVRIFAGPSDQTEVLFDGAASGEAIEMLEGRHFVEVTRDGFDRWIRNVSVRRDDTTTVKVTLTPSTPDEIR